MAYISRNGLRTTRELAYRLCLVIPRFTPLIKVAFPDEPLLYAALETLNLACAALVEQADNVLPIGD